VNSFGSASWQFSILILVWMAEPYSAINPWCCLACGLMRTRAWNLQDSETKNLTLSEAPLLLLLDPTPRPHARELPLRIFEHHIEIVGNVQKTSFVTLGYSLASEEAERIGVDHIAKVRSCSGAMRAVGICVSIFMRRVLGEDTVCDVGEGVLTQGDASVGGLCAAR
jgi:hypothetical protein